MFKGIIFDMDGTVIDTNDLIIRCLKESVQTHLGYTPSTQDLHPILGKPLQIQTAFFSEQKGPEMEADYRVCYRKGRDAETTLFPGIDELLEALHAEGLRMAVLSNKGSHGVRHALQRFQLERYFDPVITMDDVINRKPHPEGLFRILEQWGVEPAEALLIGDSANDILCANQAGVASMLVDWTILPPDQFANLRIDFRVRSTEDILALIRSHREGESQDEHMEETTGTRVQESG